MAKLKGSTAALTMNDEDKSWRARSDLRVLQEAREVESDKARVTAAKREAKAQMDALKFVTKEREARTKRLEKIKI